MPTVKDLLEDLRTGKQNLEEVAQVFAERDWKPPKAASDEEAWGVEDDDVPGDDSWETVNACSWLTPEQYNTLAAAAVATA